MKKINILYGITGLVIGALVTLSILALIHMNTKHNMRTMMAAMTQKLEAKNGAEFDQTFLEEMLVHHQGAVAMARLAIVRSERLEIKKIANEIIINQTDEFAQMEGWLSDWFQIQ